MDSEKKAIAKSNAAMRVEWNMANGGIESVVLNDDPASMNWVEGCHTWGEVRAYEKKLVKGLVWNYYDVPYMKFTGMEEVGDAVVSHYENIGLRLDVTRTMTANGFDECYEFTNKGEFPLYYLRGHVGIFATFNDSYGPAAECEPLRCDAHVFAHGPRAYVHAMKMAPFHTDLVLEMKEGELDGYSVQITTGGWSNDRGDFVLHPAPFSLRAGESRRFAWSVRAVAAGLFAPPVRAKYETCFPGEEFEIADGDGLHRVKAEKVGELEAYGARLFVSTPFDELVKRRIDFIVDKQQCLDGKSPLYGAFLIYDNEDKSQFFDDRWGDHGASQERIGMALLIARWLQTHDDERIRKAVYLFEKFMCREFVDCETGKVFNVIGHRPKENRRLYNVSWAVEFLAEMYRLDGDKSRFPAIEKAILDYYANGGAKFYPNASTFGETIAMMRDAGWDVAALLEAHRAHVYNIIANGINYPEHEVKFEQTIVSPAVEILSNYWLHIDRDPKVRKAIDNNIAVLTRFDGDQPDHVSGGVPIRHWDGYWFGKRHTYGDTLHYWGVLSGTSYLLYSKVTGDKAWEERAMRCFRNLLFLYRADGFGSCAYYIPFEMTLTDDDGNDIRTPVRGEHHDPWANDQDFGLYFMLRYTVFANAGRRRD